jgi:putative DNA primase/helicase
LTPDTSHQKILMLVGPKRSGKGTIARVLRGLIGPENVANPTLASLATNFGLAPLIGRPAAVIGDARLSGRTDVAQVVERLLSISGEDAQTIDRKHLPAVTVKLPTRLMLISNELPRLSDSSGAMTGRMILLRMTRTFYGEEDLRLTDELLRELPGILLWAVEGWRRLRDRGRFVQPKSGEALVSELEDLASPVGAFIKDECEGKPGAEVPVSELFSAWKSWCQARGRDNVGDEMRFGRDLRAVLPHLNTSQPRRPDGSRPRVYNGIRLLNAPSCRPPSY